LELINLSLPLKMLLLLNPKSMKYLKEFLIYLHKPRS
jgi:hypothetical protein